MTLYERALHLGGHDNRSVYHGDTIIGTLMHDPVSPPKIHQPEAWNCDECEKPTGKRTQIELDGKLIMCCDSCAAKHGVHVTS